MKIPCNLKVAVAMQEINTLYRNSDIDSCWWRCHAVIYVLLILQ